MQRRAREKENKVIPPKQLVATLSLLPILTWAQMKAEERVIRLYLGRRIWMGHGEQPGKRADDRLCLESQGLSVAHRLA